MNRPMIILRWWDFLGVSEILSLVVGKVMPLKQKLALKCVLLAMCFIINISLLIISENEMRVKQVFHVSAGLEVSKIWMQFMSSMKIWQSVNYVKISDHAERQTFSMGIHWYLKYSMEISRKLKQSVDIEYKFRVKRHMLTWHM